MGSSVPSSAVAFLAMLTTVCADMAVYTQSIPHTVMEEFRDMPASFGEELPFEGLRGFLVHGSPPDGCSALAPPPNNTDNFTGKWIVLVARYNCSFEEKVRNAQDAGYDCAIVHNVNSSELETMSAKDPVGIIIPSVFVSDIAGFQLADKFLYTYGFYIMVNGDLPFNINTHLLLPFAIVVVLCLIVILIFLIVKCIKDRRRARRHRLPNRSLRKIPTCKFSKGDPYDTCAICLDDYTEGERLRVLPCAHAYHAACIDPWLTQNKRVCPVCKRRVLAAGEARPREDSDDSDTEPLLAATTLTQGGTFDEQRENPFVRAARFMSRLRLGHDRPLDETDVVDENDPTESTNDSVTDERASLLPDARTGASVTAAPVHHASSPARHSPPVTTPLVPSVVTVTERRGRRSRGNRNARDTHSINNTEPQGEIGVAALPAPQPPQPPPHVDL